MYNKVDVGYAHFESTFFVHPKNSWAVVNPQVQAHVLCKTQTPKTVLFL